MLTAIVALVVTVALVPAFGIVGAAVAATLSNVVMFIYAGWAVRKHLDSHVPYRAWLKSLVAGVLFLVVAYGLKGILPLPALLEASIVCVVAGLAYVAALLVLRAVTVGEIRKVVRIVF